MIADSPCEAIILNYTNYGDADRIVTLLTLEHGICGAFARNARNSRRRFGAALQPLNRVRVLWQLRRRSGLPQMAEIELLESASGLVENLETLALGAYFCELVNALVPPEQPVPEVYNLLQVCLRQLPQISSYALARLLFELRLLEMVGLLPHIGHCAMCWEPLRDEWLLFDAARGGTLCPRCVADKDGVPVQALTLGSLARLLRVDCQRFAAIRLSEQTKSQARAVLTQVLNGCVGRRIKSEQFLSQILKDS
ncbi:MAG: DNA repair protein RecO [Desulfuromonas sp.]|nr:DNA repair protein RecO [Desulfuromonas sp.]